MYIYKNIVYIGFSEVQFLRFTVALGTLYLNVRRATLLSCLYAIYETELETVVRLCPSLPPPTPPGPYLILCTTKRTGNFLPSCFCNLGLDEYTN